MPALDFHFLQRLKRVTFRKIYQRLVPGWRYLHLSRVRKCECCGKLTLIEVRDPRGENQKCWRCGANLRYEMLASILRREIPRIDDLTILELDYRSPLRGLFQMAGRYIRTYYSESDALGSVDSNGFRCEDITRLSLPDNSVDIVISSEVLEHVPQIEKASREIARVLKPGGCHYFTVPTSDSEPTLMRAKIVDGRIVHMTDPVYHGDTMTDDGILAFWTFGRNLPKLMDGCGLRTEILAERRNENGELLIIIWRSTKTN